MIRMKQGKQGDFADVLSALGQGAAGKPSKAAAKDAEEDEEQILAGAETDSAPHPTHRLRRLLGSVAWRWRFRLGGTPSETAAAYAAEATEAAEPAEALSAGGRGSAEPAKAQGAQSEDEAIAQELGLRVGLAVGDLKQIRREFAKKNHPDRFAPALQMRAARRMSIANMLIDQHLKQKGQAR